MLQTQSAPCYLKLREELEEIELKLKDSLDRKQEKEETAAISKIREDPSAFFAYARKKARVKSQVGPLVTPSGSHTSDPEEMATLLLRQYESACSTPKEELTPELINNIFREEEEG